MGRQVTVIDGYIKAETQARRMTGHYPSDQIAGRGEVVTVQILPQVPVGDTDQHSAACMTGDKTK